MRRIALHTCVGRQPGSVARTSSPSSSPSPSCGPICPASLRIPVAGYSLLLTAMAAASTRLGPVAGVGGALFLLSDTLIATGVADWPQLPRPDFWIMLTYAAAQFLLVSGVQGTLGAHTAAGAAYGEMRSTTP